MLPETKNKLSAARRRSRRSDFCEFTDFQGRRVYPNLGFPKPPGLAKSHPERRWECADFQDRQGYQNVSIFKAAKGATNNINRFSPDLKGLFAVGSGSGRVCVTSIDFGGPFVRVLQRKAHLGSTAGGQVEFQDKPKFYIYRLCTVKYVSRGGFGTAGCRK